MRAVYILMFAAIFSFVTLYFVTPAMIIKTFFDDRIIVNFKRILLCTGIMTGIGILFAVFMMITENNGKLAAYIFIPLLMIVLLIVMPIIFAYRRGLP